MVRFRILEQDGCTIEAEIEIGAGTVSLIGCLRLDGDRVVLYDLHLDGPGLGRIGLARLKRAMRHVMELYDVDLLEIHGFRRTTGATPGRVPGPLLVGRLGDPERLA